MFLIVVSLEDKNVYWASVEASNREGRFKRDKKTASILINKSDNFSEKGLNNFKLIYFREKKWSVIENAIEKSLMSYNSIGPLVLMCNREMDEKFCSTAVQFLLLQHYEYYTLLSRFLFFKQTKNLHEWYNLHAKYIEEKLLTSSLTFSYKVIKRMIAHFIWDYRKCILEAYKLVTDKQEKYYRESYPYLCAHLKERPYAFIQEDWAPRYFFDEYEMETMIPEKLFFQDFEEFDFMINELTKT